MKKRIFCLILALVMVLSLAACAGSGNDNTENTKDTTTNTEGSEATTPVSGGEAELALITDANSIDDRGFNQFSWEGLKQYAEENGKTYTYYTPIDQSTQSYLSAIEGAVNNGAKLIVTPGFLFGEAIYKAQTMYPDALWRGKPQRRCRGCCRRRTRPYARLRCAVRSRRNARRCRGRPVCQG